MPSIAREITRFSKKEVDGVFKHARCVFRSKSCTLLYAPRHLSFGRILIVVSKKVGNAPVRNKIRRRVKSIFYEEKLFEVPYDFVIIAYKSLAELSFEELKKLLVNGVAKASEIGGMDNVTN